MLQGVKLLKFNRQVYGCCSFLVNPGYFCPPMNEQPSLYFAPFQGITTKAFREVYARHFFGTDKLYTPYFANIAVDYPLPPLKLKALREQFENGIPVIPQILSKSAPEILWFAQCCAGLGFDELNWNLGCPYPQVARKKRGSGLLPHPEMVGEILDQLMNRMPLRFSVKCRLGYGDAGEIQNLIPVFNRYPLSEIIIHPRIGKQLYSGSPDLRAFGEAFTALQHPVVYNGDVTLPANLQYLKSEFPGINRFMIGRGLLADPFLAARIKGIALNGEETGILKKFTDDLYYTYRNDKKESHTVLNAMKEYWKYLILSFDDPQSVFRKIRKTASYNEYEEAVKRVFDEHALAEINPSGIFPADG